MKIEMYADVLCPWCYIGKRRLATALTGAPDRHRTQVVWRSYELAPHEGRTPGRTAAEAMADWWADAAPARIARIRTLGAAEGLELNLHLARPVNTFDAHRLGHLAADRGLADEMMERLLRGYHTEGLDIAAPDTLERLGVEAGLDVTDVRTLLARDAYADRVRADERRAVECGVTGVPSLVIDGRPPISGVQAPERLRRLLSGPPAVPVE
ncbi:putative DsbA family dithiol-disulfide isomerase [Micromonospora sp. M71_S20]|uniref:DsbA family oxidoreductase n=1 Tax=Micromonospora sp. M71_S20 TaxID=592872 RepID=UPI000EAD192D|nr:DsbA family oxidoreductase [Micromonospora sp. M71_S20]RLK22295.1 putative DsbA family dithiol-disulfide isomerase [Micromonospora sp. M71_S20]